MAFLKLHIFHKGYYLLQHIVSVCLSRFKLAILTWNSLTMQLLWLFCSNLEKNYFIWQRCNFVNLGFYSLGKWRIIKQFYIKRQVLFLVADLKAWPFSSIRFYLFYSNMSKLNKICLETSSILCLRCTLTLIEDAHLKLNKMLLSLQLQSLQNHTINWGHSLKKVYTLGQK